MSLARQVDLIEALDRRAARRVALRLVAQRGLEVLGRDVALGLPQDLHDVAVGVVEAVGGTVAVVAVKSQPMPSPVASIAATWRCRASALVARHAMWASPERPDTV